MICPQCIRSFYRSFGHDFLFVASFYDHVVQQMPEFGPGVHPRCLLSISLSELGVGNGKFMFDTLRSSSPFEFTFPTPSLPMASPHSVESRPTRALKSPRRRSLSLFGTVVSVEGGIECLFDLIVGLQLFLIAIVIAIWLPLPEECVSLFCELTFL